MKKEASFYQTFSDSLVVCGLCPHHCHIKDGKKGICLNRENQNGILYALGYGKIAAAHLDPIEKKPLFHFFPSMLIFSIGAYGCSFACPFCQNFSISRITALEQETVSPLECIGMAKESGSSMIAYTYNEPYINFEYVLETAKLARENNLKNVLVTNGYYETIPWEELSPYIDAMNIDLKGDAAFYKRLCAAEVEPVLRTIKSAFNKGIHVEVTALLIPNENDSEESLDFIIDNIAAVSNEIPLHFSKYFPQYHMNQPPTDSQILLKAYEKAKNKLKYVYIGNLRMKGKEDTLCPECKTTLIERDIYQTKILEPFKKGKCEKCGYVIYGKF